MLNLQGSKILNPELKDLLNREDVPAYVISLLEDLNIFSLSDLSCYYKENGSFYNICGHNKKLDALLHDLCLQYNDAFLPDTVCGFNNDEFWKNIPNLSLYDLIEVDYLTKRSFTVCSKYNLLTLKSIVEFYLKHGSFVKLYSIGAKSNEELIFTCNKYINISKLKCEQQPDCKDEGSAFTSNGAMVVKKETNEISLELDTPSIDVTISIEELARFENISIRSQNVCNLAQIKNLNDLLQFYKDNLTFLKLKNSGRRTNEELLRISKKYSFFSKRETEKPVTRSLNDFIASFDELHLGYLKNIIQQKISALSKRSEIILNNYLGKDVSTQEFFIRLSSFEAKSYQKAQNIGKRSILELDEFISSVFEDAKIIATKDKQNIEQEQIVQLYSDHYQINREQMQTLLFKKTYFSYLSFIDHCISNSFKLKRSHKAIFDMMYKNKPIQIEEACKELRLSRERIRQLNTKIFSMFFTDFILTNTWSKTQLLKCIDHVIDVSSELILLDSAAIKKINEQNETNYNSAFFSRLFAWLFEDSHIQILQGEKKPHNIYFISNKYASLFDFDKCIKDMRLLISERIEDDCVMNMDGYIFGFMRSQNFDCIENVKNVINKIVHKDFFGLIGIDIDSNLVFYKNTGKSKTDSLCRLLEEILEEEGRPMNVKQLQQVVLNINSSLLPSNSDEYIRSVMLKNKSIFAPIGRTSTYGLCLWEKQRSNFKGGSIRKIAREFLNIHNEPKHIYEIFSFVKRYRPSTTLRSVQSNMAVDRLHAFVKFTGGFWGLTEKNYSLEMLNFKPFPPSVVRLVQNVLKKYRMINYARLVKFLSNYYQLREIQIVAYLEQAIEEKKLTFSDDSIYIYNQNSHQQC